MAKMMPKCVLSRMLPTLLAIFSLAQNAQARTLQQQLAYSPLHDLNIKPVLSLWIFDEASALQQYGPIEQWDTSEVTSFQSLFQDVATDFNYDLNGWNTAKVTSMMGLAMNSPGFNAKISDWNTSQVFDLTQAFRNATSFQGDLSRWNTENVLSMLYTFQGATQFNSDISQWNTGSCNSMLAMFNGTAQHSIQAKLWLRFCVFFQKMSHFALLSRRDLL
jgi:Mycoplasma protein of unknown function, DUF285